MRLYSLERVELAENTEEWCRLAKIPVPDQPVEGFISTAQIRRTEEPEFFRKGYGGPDRVIRRRKTSRPPGPSQTQGARSAP